jgi:hypothetical protein
MNERQLKKLDEHFTKYFGQTRLCGMNSEGLPLPVEVSLFAPNEKYPFWKLTTAGASDVVAEGQRTEFMMFIDGRVRLVNDKGELDPAELSWYYNVLLNAALYPKTTGKAFGYRKVVEFDCGRGMCGATALLPKVIDDAGIFRCQLNEGKVIECYLLITITKKELEDFKQNGIDYLDHYFYPSEGHVKFFCEPYRSEF